jgi:hypothetical protein
MVLVASYEEDGFAWNGDWRKVLMTLRRHILDRIDSDLACIVQIYRLRVITTPCSSPSVWKMTPFFSSFIRVDNHPQHLLHS